MANHDNECKDLVIPQLESMDFDEVFQLQKELQDVMGFDFSKMTVAELANFWMTNKHAFDDEFGEMMDALGGSDLGNAAWKHWKHKHDIAKQRRINQLEEGDMIELKFEIVDAFHFFVNFAISIGMTGSELYSMYRAKNDENHNRQENNY